MNKSAARQQAEKLVDIYLNWALSTDQDAGWHSGSVIGRLVDFRGDLPQSSGFYGVDRMEKELRFLTGHHADLPIAKAAVAALHDNYKIAVFTDRHYRNRVKVAIDPFVPNRRVEFKYTDEALAAMLSISVRTYRYRVDEGYRQIGERTGVQKAA